MAKWNEAKSRAMAAVIELEDVARVAGLHDNQHMKQVCLELRDLYRKGRAQAAENLADVLNDLITGLTKPEDKQ